MKDNFDRLYYSFHQDLYQFIFYMVKNKYLTEDLIQEVYIRVLKSYDTFKGDSSEKTWLFSIARHITIDHFRSQGRHRRYLSRFFDWQNKGESIKDQGKLPDTIMIENEEINQVYNCLDKCTIDQRSVIILRFIQSFSIKETADILNFSISKIKTTQHRGLKVLRQHLEDIQEGGARRL